MIITAVVIVGIGLVVYSRNERLHPVTTSANAGPTKSDNWHIALAFDVCGTVQPAIPANTNLATVGIRTFGDGLINIDPSVASKPANYEGAKATLALFVSSYPGIDITSKELLLPGKGQKTWSNGTACTAKDGPGTGPGIVQIKLWSSPTAKGKLVSATPADLHLRNGQMITVAFLPKGKPIPVPPSKAALLAALGETSTSSTSTTLPAATTSSAPTASTSGSSTTSSTVASSTTTTSTASSSTATSTAK